MRDAYENEEYDLDLTKEYVVDRIQTAWQEIKRTYRPPPPAKVLRNAQEYKRTHSRMGVCSATPPYTEWDCQQASDSRLVVVVDKRHNYLTPAQYYRQSGRLSSDLITKKEILAKEKANEGRNDRVRYSGVQLEDFSDEGKQACFVLRDYLRQTGILPSD
jgi:hypothetical protein